MNDLSGVDVVGIVGSIFSITAAIWAWWQATRAGTFAEQVEELLKRKRATSELSAFVEKWEHIHPKLAVWCQVRSRRGYRIDEVRTEVQAYVHAARRLRQQLAAVEDVTDRLVEIESLLGELVNSASEELRATSAQSLLRALEDLTADVRDLVDAEVQRVDEPQG